MYLTYIYISLSILLPTFWLLNESTIDNFLLVKYYNFQYNLVAPPSPHTLTRWMVIGFWKSAPPRIRNPHGMESSDRWRRIFKSLAILSTLFFTPFDRGIKHCPLPIPPPPPLPAALLASNVLLSLVQHKKTLPPDLYFALACVEVSESC